MQKWILSLLLLASPVMADPIKEDEKGAINQTLLMIGLAK